MTKTTNDGIAAASATYRKATTAVARLLKVKPDHTVFPKEDFFRDADLIEPKSRKRALKFYDLGVRRGLKQATDWFVDGTIKYRNHTVVAPARLTVRSRIKFSGKWEKHSVRIATDDIGFQ